MASVMVFILILSFLVIIHELGHFLVALWRGVGVLEFGLGYPPRVLKVFTWLGTPFTLNWIPFGGFVRLSGEDGADVTADPDHKPTNSSAKNQEFYRASTLSRLIIVLAGPIVNFLFGILAFAVVFSISGVPEPLVGQARIGQIAPGSPADLAKLTPGTNIIGFQVLEGERVSTTSISQVQEYVQTHKGQQVQIVVSGPCQADACAESASVVDLYLRADSEIPAGQGSMGVVFQDYYLKQYPWYLRPVYGSWYGLTQAVSLGTAMLQSLGGVLQSLVTDGKAAAEVAGPIGIVHQAQKSNLLGEGLLMVLSFAGMLSINLAIMNVLPIPALDGGRAAFILLGALVGQQRIEKIENYANYGGFIALLGMIIMISVRDIARILQGG